VTSPAGLALDSAGNVYWTSSIPTTGSVGKVTPAGVMTTLASNQNNPSAIAVDPTHVYWCNDNASGSVFQLTITPTVGLPLSLAGGQKQPISIAVDASYVYWANNDSGNGSGSVVKVPIGGGTVITLASGESSIDAIALDPSYVYWTNPFEGTVKRVHK
jgi:hypothetical protein